MAKNDSTNPKPRAPFLRVVSVLLAAWLLAMPQVMFSRNMAAYYAEMGTKPPPIVEEEEVKHACTFNEVTCVLSAPSLDLDGALCPLQDERLLLALHGEVASPPPKA